ncbi:MAG: MFS transporter [Nitriliruptoraceae bacterium]|nr:MFS transporter [Nitriliruptoraceae bacterium]
MQDATSERGEPPPTTDAMVPGGAADADGTAGPADGTGTGSFAIGRIWWLAVGMLGIQAVFALYNAFLPLLYGDFLTSRTLIGLLMGTDNLIGLLLIPVVGAWSDRLDSRHGRRLPFIVIALPFAALTFAAIPFAAVLLWTLIVTEVVFTAAMHAFRSPYVAMLVDHTPPARRSTTSGIAQFVGGLGVLAAFAVISPLFDTDRRLPFAIGAVLLLSSLIAIWTRAQRFPAHLDNAPVPARNPVRDVADELRALTRPPQRGRRDLLLAMLLTYGVVAGLQAMFPLFAIDVLGLTGGRAAQLLTAFAGAFLLTALIAGAIGTRYGVLPTMRVALVALPVCWFTTALLSDANAVAGMLVLGGAAWALFVVPAVALMADLGGRDRIGFVLSLYYVFTMLGQMVGPLLLGAAMDLLGPAGLWIGAGVVTSGGSWLVWRGQRALDADPHELATRTLLR